MTRMGLIKAATVVAVLVAASLLIVLARSVSSVGGELRVLDSSAARVHLAADPELLDFGSGDRVARAMLAVDDDFDFRVALGLIEQSRNFDHLPSRVIELHAEAVALLLPMLDSGEPHQASLSASLVGALYAEDLLIDPEGAGRYAEQAVDAFRQAVLSDSSNDSAKIGLELVLRRLASGATEDGDVDAGAGVTGAGDVRPGTGY